MKAPTDRNQPGMDLVRCVNRNLLATTTQTPEMQWLMSDVETLQFDCFDGTQWRNTWDTSAGDTNLPMAVRIRIQMRRQAGSQDAANQQPIEMHRAAGLPDAHQPDGGRTPNDQARSATHARASRRARFGPRHGSVLVIVLWIAFGLVSLALYFANSMNFELHASDNRVSAKAADQAIEGAVRYSLTFWRPRPPTARTASFRTSAISLCQAVPVGDAHYWLIGRDTNAPVGPGQMCFGLVDEASKLNLNRASSNAAHLAPAHDGGPDPGDSRLAGHQRHRPDGHLLRHAAAGLPVQVRSLRNGG